MKPSVVRAVHYVSRGSADGVFTSVCRAAIITEALDKDDNVIRVCVINPTGLFFSDDIEYSDSNAAGTWHWPERESE